MLTTRMVQVKGEKFGRNVLHKNNQHDKSFCKFDNFLGNFVFVNNVKSSVCHIKIRDFVIFYLHQ